MAISSPEIMLVPKTSVSMSRRCTYKNSTFVAPKYLGSLEFLTQVDVTKAAASNFASDAVFITDTQIHGRHLECEAALAALDMINV